MITQAQLDEALKSQIIFGGRLGTNLVELGYLDEEALAYFLSESLEVPYAHPKTLLEIDPEIIALVPRHVAERYRVLPVEVRRKRLRLVMADPQDYEAVREISFITGYSIEPLVTPEMRLAQALDIHYGIPRDVRYIAFRDDLRERKELEKIESKRKGGAAETAGTHHYGEIEFASEPPDHSVKKKEGKHGEKTAQHKAPQHHRDTGVNFETLSDPAEGDEKGSLPKETALSEDILQEKVRKLREKRRQMLAQKRGQGSKEEPRPESSLQVETLSQLGTAPDRKAVGDVLLHYLGMRYPLGAILAVRGEMALGWCATGSPHCNEFVPKLRVPLNVPSILKEAADSGLAIQEGSDKVPMDKMLRKIIGVEKSLRMVATAVYYRHAVVCFLLAVGPAEVFTGEATGELKIIAKEAGNAFARLIKPLHKEAT